MSGGLPGTDDRQASGSMRRNPRSWLTLEPILRTPHLAHLGSLGSAGFLSIRHCVKDSTIACKICPLHLGPSGYARRGTDSVTPRPRDRARSHITLCRQAKARPLAAMNAIARLTTMTATGHNKDEWRYGVG